MPDRIEQFLTDIRRHHSLAKILISSSVLEASEAQYDDSYSLFPPLQTALRAQGINRLYAHQTQALNAAKAKKNVVVATHAASGKSMSYFLPALESAMVRGGRSLFLYPLKALENDQLKKWNELTSAMPLPQPPRAAIYDGDTPDSMRRLIRRNPPQALFTTPDMLNLGILPYHSLWRTFFESLSIVVVDELHTYRGVFGTHMAWVFRRLQRICQLYGVKPTFLATSATIANPGELGTKLFDGEAIAITESGAPRSKRHVLLFNPDETSAFTETARLLMVAVANGLRTIVFTRSRQETERMFIAVAEKDPLIAQKISSYRAGFLPEERREIERKLSDGELLGVISTSALELGIDIGGLDVCILSGFPGLISQTWQRWGRVGRGDNSAAVALIASSNALDQYLLRHPDELLSRPFETANINHDNEFVLDAHLLCAAQEIPLKLDEPWLQPKVVKERVAAKIAAGELLESAEGGQWFPRDTQPQRKVDLRSIGSSFSIVDLASSKRIGEISGETAFRECHNQAVYLHMGRSYVVDSLETGTSTVFVTEPTPTPSYYTMPRSEKETEILEIYEEKNCGPDKISFGKLRVHERVVGYERRNREARTLEGVFPLEMPETIYETTGCWIEMPSDLIEDWRNQNHHFPGARHAAEHAFLAMLPLLALCDRNDVGGITMDMHPQTRRPTIFLYDGYAGGAGLTLTGYRMLTEWLQKTLRLVEECPCTEPDGCPSCIQSPKCGSGNRPLDKQGTIALFRRWLSEAEQTGTLFPTLPAKTIVPPKEPQPVLSVLPTEQTGTVYFDVETLRSADEVGGWSNIHLMGLALAVIFDERTQQYSTYFEKDLDRLIAHLDSAQLIVGYNTIRFDYEVLRGYIPRTFKEWRSFDMLPEVQHRFGGKRLPLSALAKASLHDNKSADGLQSLQWVKEGKWQLIEEYCRHDVKLTRDIFRYALDKGYLLTEDRKGNILKIQLDWNLAKILE